MQCLEKQIQTWIALTHVQVGHIQDSGMLMQADAWVLGIALLCSAPGMYFAATLGISLPLLGS